VHLEAVAHRAGQHAAARRGADEREPLEVHRDGPRAHPLTQHDVDAEVLHGGVDELLHHARHPVDLVDEQHRTRLEVREEREQVGRLRERGAAGHLDARAQFVREHGRERGLAQARRTVEEDVSEWFFQLFGSADGDLQSLRDLPLTDHFLEQLRAQRRIERLVLFVATTRRDHFLASHCVFLALPEVIFSRA